MRLEAQRMAWGDLQLTSCTTDRSGSTAARCSASCRGRCGRRSPPDDRNRIQLAMRPLLVEADWGRMIIDCGAGDKMNAKERDIYALDRTPAARSRAGRGRPDRRRDRHRAGDAPALRSFRRRDDATGRRRLVPRFPHARYMIRAAEWEDATHPHERNRASYLQDDFVPLKDAGVVDFFERRRGRSVRACASCAPAATPAQHQIVFIESGGKTAVFTADLIPTTAHIQDPWIMGYDLFPMETLAFKKRVHPRGDRPRVPDLLRARSASSRPATSARQDGRRLRRAGAVDSRRSVLSGNERRSYRLQPQTTNHRPPSTTMEQVQIGIIGGSGLYDMADVTDREEVALTTPFGDPSGPYVLGTLRGKRVAFLARHGAGHRLLPVGAELPRQHLRHEAARRRVHPVGQRGRQPEGRVQAARHRHSRSVHRPHAGRESARSSAAAWSRTSASRIRSAAS